MLKNAGLPSPRQLTTSILVALFLISLTLLVPAISEDVPVVTNVQNAGPGVHGIILNDGTGASVDPGTKFTIEVEVEDDNTIQDISRLRIILYSPSSSEGGSPDQVHHYRFRWERGVGFRNDVGFGSVITGECMIPSDQTKQQGTWKFSLKLEKSALYSSSWKLLALVEDESKQDRMDITFGVTRYSSIHLSDSEISFSGAPGSQTQAAQNPIILIYSTNHQAAIGCWAETFVGVSRQEFIIDATAFSVDDDGNSGESPEVGRNPLVLTNSRQVLSQSSPAVQAEVALYLFVQIPDPFYDQEYTGKIIFDMGAS